MTVVGDVLNYLQTLAPVSMKMDWDNVGLLCGSRTAPVTKVLVALDPFEHVCAEAEEVGAQLLVTHHPLIFTAPKTLTDETSLGRCVRRLCRAGISAVNAHTNLDCAPGGVNDVLAETLGLRDVSVICPEGLDDQGREWGLLRRGTVERQTLPEFLDHVRNALNCPGLRYTDGGREVRNVAVGGGACAGELGDAIRAGCDTFVTSDVKYNQFWDAKEAGLNLIDAGHFYTENPVVAMLAEKLSREFPEIRVEISKTHRDCMKYY